MNNLLLNTDIQGPFLKKGEENLNNYTSTVGTPIFQCLYSVLILPITHYLGSSTCILV